MFDRTAHISLHFYSNFKELASEETSSSSVLQEHLVAGEMRLLGGFSSCCNSYFHFYCRKTPENYHHHRFERHWLAPSLCRTRLENSSPPISGQRLHSPPSPAVPAGQPAAQALLAPCRRSLCEQLPCGLCLAGHVQKHLAGRMSTAPVQIRPHRKRLQYRRSIPKASATVRHS